MTLSEAFKAYARDVIAFRNQSAKTEEHHNVALRSLIMHLGDIPIDELDFPSVREWKLSLEKRKLSSATIRGYLNKLRVVLAYLQTTGVRCLSPESILLPKRQYSVPVFITPIEVATLIGVLGRAERGYARINRIRNQAIISLLYGSGIRIGECCSLNRDSVYNGTFTVIGKGNKARICFIDERTKDLLRQYLILRTDNNPALFLSNQTQSRIRPGTMQRVLASTWKLAGFSKPVHPHTLRHSFATNLLRNNANPRYVQALLGHSSLETTQMYMSVVDNDLKAVYERYHTV